MSYIHYGSYGYRNRVPKGAVKLTEETVGLCARCKQRPRGISKKGTALSYCHPCTNEKWKEANARRKARGNIGIAMSIK